MVLVLLFVSSISISALVTQKSAFVIIKPNCAANGAEAGIVSMIRFNGYEISKMKRMMLTEKIVR